VPRVTFLQVGCGGGVEHTISDLRPDGSAWDDIDEDDEDTIPTCTLYGEGGAGTIAAARPCAIPPATELSDACEEQALVLVVESAEGLERWQEIVVGPGHDGRWEWAVIDGIEIGGDDEDDTIHLLAPLRYAYAEGTPVGSRTLRASFSSDEITRVLRDCRLEWRYRRDERTPVDHTIVHLSRYAPRYALSAAEVNDAEPKAIRMLGPGQRLDLVIRREWERRVLPSIARIMPPGALVSGEAADELLLAAVCQRLTNAARDDDAADRWGARYETLLGGLGDTLTDFDEDGVVDPLEKPRSPRAPRLMRG